MIANENTTILSMAALRYFVLLFKLKYFIKYIIKPKAKTLRISLANETFIFVKQIHRQFIELQIPHVFD